MKKMKESKVKWIGNVPLNWKIGKVKDVFIRKNEKANLEKPIVLSLARSGVKVRDISNGEGQLAESYTNYNPVKINDLLLNPMDLYSGANCSVSKVGGVISPAYINLRPKGNNNSKYYDYYFKTQYWSMAFFAHGKGVSFDNRWTLGLETAMNYYIPIPPEKEQEKIANFIDKKVTEIDNVVKKTRETIRDYKKYKKSIITKVITKGLKKNIEIKDSGIDWIGNINKLYKIIDFKYLLKSNMQYGANESGISYDKNLPRYIRITDINENGELKEEGILSLNEEAAQNYILENGDILFARSGATVGKSFIYNNKYGRCAFAGYLIRATVRNIINPKFIYYYTLSNIYDIWKNGIFIQATIQNIGADKYMNMPIVYPECKKEQNEIIDYLDKKCMEIDKLITNKEKIIEELEQYKKSLIYEYVTGKKEVKENNFLKENDAEKIKINCKDNIFAQAILLCRIIEKLNKHNLGRVKAEKVLYLIEQDIGFNFDNNYAREAAGPLSEAIYKCESVISKKNKWIKVNKVKKHIEYEILSDFNKYNKYYEKYYSSYDNQIENIINIIKNYTTDKAEMVATLYASWNDFIIKKEEVSDIKIVKDVRENWNDTKKRFKENEWLDVLKEMKQVGLIPKGKGNLTIIKEQ